MLGCQVNSTTPLGWDEGMGHLCLVPSTWEASCSVCSSEGATGMEDVCGGLCVCVGFWGDPGGHGDFREMERGMDILGWCFCEWEVESRKRGRTGWNWEGVPLPRVLSVHRAGLTEVSLPGHFSHTAHPLSCSWAR